MRERELKFALPGRFTVPPLHLDGAALEVEALPEQNLRATYYDTTDLRLARHGVTLRYRTGDTEGPIWTLKLPVSKAGAEVVRDEIHLPGARREPPQEARSLVTAFARLEPLVAVASLRTRRRRFRLLGPDGPLAEVDDDEVSVFEGRRVVSRFRELELEALSDDLDLSGLAQQLHQAGATDAEPIPKVVRALGSRATAPADVAGANVPDDPSMGDAVTAAIADALHRLVHHDPAARIGVPEGVHQLRVALRRLRSDLRTLGDAVDPAWSGQIEPRLRAVADALAEARDLDVLSEALRSDAGDAADSLAPLFDGLDRRRAAARERVRAALDDPGYPALLDALVDAVARPPLGSAAAVPADEGMPAAVLAAWRRLQRRADALDEGSDDADFHRARIAAKRARYASELAARVLGAGKANDAARLASKIASVQEDLGALQDAAVAEAAVRDALGDGPNGAAFAFDAGRLVERQRARAAAARLAFLKRWSAVRRRKWRAWAS